MKTLRLLCFLLLLVTPCWAGALWLDGVEQGVGLLEVTQAELDAAIALYDTEAELEAIAGALFGASKAVTAGWIWVADDTDFESVVMSGDVTISSGGVTAIGADKIVNADINSAAAIAQSKLATLVGANEAYDVTNWDADTGIPEKDDIRDYCHLFDTDGDGDLGDQSRTISAAYTLGSGGSIEGITDIQIDGTADGMGNSEYQGTVITGIVAGEDIALWQPVFLATDGKWDEADANAAGEFPALGIAVACPGGPDFPCQVDEELTVLVKGIGRFDTWTLATIGGKVYLSETLCGSAVCDDLDGTTDVAPSDSTDCVQIVGFALTDDEIYFDFSRPYSEVD